MTRTRSAILMTLAGAGATLLFWFLLHSVFGMWLDVALHPEVRAVLERSLEDQKRLRAHDPAGSAVYRQRFDETQRLLNRMEVLRMNRAAMLRRFELAGLAVFALIAAAVMAILWFRHRRVQARERDEYLQRVTALQETARRHAHEIKGPLTAARLELERYADLVRGGASETELARASESVSEELERLTRYTRAFSSFAGLGKPAIRRESLGEMVQEFCVTFSNAWPGMALQDSGGDAIVCADRDMVRQVFVNLCSNSAGAGARAVRFSILKNGNGATLDVRDDGRGIPDTVRTRVFDPYVTTRGVGEGMGLGLSISRKVMLEHGGDLQLLQTSDEGTTMRVTFGDGSC
jgi:signal transduction histidine kinase